mmetsp:Transcript_29988/g.48430  ORF Transcript_29988/g.48430 Transcript_29988/m.48430 type:complete len:91 (+) Transcript_29988:298-570(+)
MSCFLLFATENFGADVQLGSVISLISAASMLPCNSYDLQGLVAFVPMPGESVFQCLNRGKAGPRLGVNPSRLVTMTSSCTLERLDFEGAS